MKAWVVAFLSWLVLGTATAAAAPDSVVSEEELQRQILVLLRMPPSHYRPDGNYTSGYADASGTVARHRLAAALARENGLALVTSWPMPALGLDCYVMLATASDQARESAARLSQSPSVAWAQPMSVFHSLASADSLTTLQPAAREWHLSELHRISTGRGVRVAIIDSGVQENHPDLLGQIASREDFVGDHNDQPEAHGTAVAGIVAARADDRARLAGISPQARILALRACRQASTAQTVCSTLSLALALHAGIERHAQVLNMSLSGPPDRLIEQLIRAALGRGISVVAAIDPASSGGGFPADVPGVVAVADEARGPVAAGAVAAPGTDVPTTLPGSRWGFVTGTSYAAAHVSGLLALMREARGADSPPSTPLAASLVLKADGRVDPCASLGRVRAGCACECPVSGQSLSSAAPH
jgi:subtilisin family serine protease